MYIISVTRSCLKYIMFVTISCLKYIMSVTISCLIYIMSVASIFFPVFLFSCTFFPYLLFLYFFPRTIFFTYYLPVIFQKSQRLKSNVLKYQLVVFLVHIVISQFMFLAE
jgi:hypothetical protein